MKGLVFFKDGHTEEITDVSGDKDVTMVETIVDEVQHTYTRVKLDSLGGYSYAELVVDGKGVRVETAAIERFDIFD